MRIFDRGFWFNVCKVASHVLHFCFVFINDAGRQIHLTSTEILSLSQHLHRSLV